MQTVLQDRYINSGILSHYFMQKTENLCSYLPIHFPVQKPDMISLNLFYKKKHPYIKLI